MTRMTAFLVAAPLPFAALLTQHPMGGTDLYELVAGNLTPWLAIHYAGLVFFPLMALVVWLLVRGLPGRAATVTRVAMPVFAVFYTAWEAIFGIATGVLARAGDADGIDAILHSPIVGEPGLLLSIGSLAWWTGIAGAILALKRAGAGRAPLVLLGLGGLMVFHVPIGPPALVCLSAAAYVIERRVLSRPVGAAL
jgi:hypothetical protein